MGVVTTPAGKPPCSPSGKEPTEQVVTEWADEIIRIGRQQGLEYAPSAVKYYARYFWDANGGAFKEACRIIDLMLN